MKFAGNVPVNFRATHRAWPYYYTILHVSYSWLPVRRAMKTKRAAFEVEAATLDELCDKVYGMRSDEVRDGTEVRMPASMMLRHTITVSLLHLWITSLTSCCLNLSNPGLTFTQGVIWWRGRKLFHCLRGCLQAVLHASLHADLRHLTASQNSQISPKCIKWVQEKAAKVLTEVLCWPGIARVLEEEDQVSWQHTWDWQNN